MESQFADDLKIKNIINNTCLYFGVTPEDVFKNTRKKESIVPRQIIHYLCKKNTKKTYDKIGLISLEYGRFKKHDHASVLHSCNVVNGLMFSDKEFCKDVEKIYFMCVENSTNNIDSDLEVKDYIEIKHNLEELISKKDKEILKLKLQLKEKNGLKNKHLCKLLEQKNEIIDQFCETRLKPYLLMLKSRVTNEDLIEFQKKTRTI